MAPKRDHGCCRESWKSQGALRARDARDGRAGGTPDDTLLPRSKPCGSETRRAWDHVSSSLSDRGMNDRNLVLCTHAG